MKYCPVCGGNEYTYLRCYRPDCTDGRGLIGSDIKTEELIKNLSKKHKEV